MIRNRLLSGSIATLLMALPALAATGHYAIGNERVAAAIGGIGMQVAPDQVTMLSHAVANTPAPQLQVRSVERWPGNRVMVRLECASEEECLPFFVSIRLDQRAPVQPPASATTVAAEAATQPAAAAPEKARAAVRSGETAVLLMDGAHIHIRMAVVCLESGAVGQTVHATDANHQQTYAAQVVGAGILRGRL